MAHSGQMWMAQHYNDLKIKKNHEQTTDERFYCLECRAARR